MGGARERGIAPLVVLCVASACACSGDTRAPKSLLDGTRVEPPSVALEAASPQVLTKVSIAATQRPATNTRVGRCLAAATEHAPTGPIVERIGVNARSVTLRTESGRALVACDGAARLHDGASPWCGRAYGVLENGRLRDARLDLAGCMTVHGEPLAFAWIDPGPTTSYVAVRQRGFVEVYPVVAQLPVRISTTTDISLGESSARFEISEHDEGGTLLRSSTLEARVAG